MVPLSTGRQSYLAPWDCCQSVKSFHVTWRCPLTDQVTLSTPRTPVTPLEHPNVVPHAALDTPLRPSQSPQSPNSNTLRQAHTSGHPETDGHPRTPNSNTL
jgi:hypothetical protein